jgi:3-methyladenine DNA glycosylase/8-oxoguanine DNA glycosylase
MPAFRIALPRDFNPRFALRYMSRDPESETERGDARSFAKALMVEGKPSVVRVDFAGSDARVSTDARRSDVEPTVLRLLGLPFDPTPFEAKHVKLVGARRGMRVPQTASVFESIMWAICGQQVNLAFAFKLRRAVIELAGKRIDGMRAHPDPDGVAKLDYDDLTRRQFSRRKAEYLIDVARSGMDFESLRSEQTRMSALQWSADIPVRDRLCAIRGFGVWSANYVMMRGCGFADCVPVGDSGLTSSLQEFYRLDARPDAEKTLALMKRFAPYRSLATFHFWMRKIR